MNCVVEIKQMLGLTISQCSQLFGVSYSDMSDIMEGKKNPSDRLIQACNLAKEIFLNNNNTYRVETIKKGSK